MTDWTKPQSYEPIDKASLAIRDHYTSLGFKVASISTRPVIIRPARPDDPQEEWR